MKITDDYKAKYRLWAENQQVAPAIALKLPPFKSRKFSSHAEMNQWKKELLLEIARHHAANG